MRNLSQALRKIVRHPNLLAREFNRRYYDFSKGAEFNREGVDIIGESWDNLLILDACRYDMFERKNDIPGTLEFRESRGGNTVEFLFGNFKDQKLLDTVYITSNPQYYRYKDRMNTKFHSVWNVWQEEGWDEEYHTVLPETVTKRAIEAESIYPHKRLIVHYVQPHYPFINRQTDFSSEQAFLKPDEVGTWEQIVRGEISVDKDEVWEAYCANLDIVLPEAERLVEELTGTTVITSDHGNMVGERAFPIPVVEWGHMAGLYTPELVKIPWLVCQSEESKEITADEPLESQGSADPEVHERLKQLGYE